MKKIRFAIMAIAILSALGSAFAFTPKHKFNCETSAWTTNGINEDPIPVTPTGGHCESGGSKSCLYADEGLSEECDETTANSFYTIP